MWVQCIMICCGSSVSFFSTQLLNDQTTQYAQTACNPVYLHHLPSCSLYHRSSTLQSLYLGVEAALEEVQFGLSKQFRPSELSKLLEGRYISAARIRAATRESLQSIKLPAAAIDLIFAATHPQPHGALSRQNLQSLLYHHFSWNVKILQYTFTLGSIWYMDRVVFSLDAWHLTNLQLNHWVKKKYCLQSCH